MEVMTMKVFNLFLTVMMAIMFAACPPPTPEEGGQIEVKPSGLTVRSLETVLPLNGKLLLTASVQPAKADQTVKWSSDNTEVATVDAYGVVTGLKTGTVTVTAASVVNPQIKGSIVLTCESTAIETEWSYDGTDFVLRLGGIKEYIDESEETIKPTSLYVNSSFVGGSANRQMITSGDTLVRFPKTATQASVSFEFKTEDGTDVTETYTKDFPDLSSIQLKSASAEITPAHVNILRKTDITGEPSTKALVAFSFPDMEVLMNEKWFSDGKAGSYDFTKALWSGTVNTGSEVTVPDGTSFAGMYEFDLELGSDKNCSVTNAEILVPGKTPDFIGLLTTTWGSDKLFGDSVTVKGSREYPAEIWLDDQGNYSETAVEGYTKYVLSWGDDFNYPFNGLNYKNNSDYLAARETEGDPAHDFARLWGCEQLQKGSHPRKSGVWDFRTVEAKNGMLLSKHMAADADNGIFYLGAGKTKPLAGYDIATGSVKNYISGAAVTNGLYGKGFYIAKLRTRYKGYSDTKNIGNGAWFAFWLHGPVHEFDLMEQTAGLPQVINQVNQYHNGWGTYGSTYMSYFYNKVNVDSGSDVQDNWYALALQWTDTQVTYYYNKNWMYYFRANDNNTQASRTLNSSLNGISVANGNGNQSVNTSGMATSYTEYGYNKTLKAVPSAPMNVFLSTEIGPGWGGNPTAAETDYLPVWVEADYIAYYVPEGSN